MNYGNKYEVNYSKAKSFIKTSKRKMIVNISQLEAGNKKQAASNNLLTR